MHIGTFKYRHWKFPVDYCKTWIFFLLLFCLNVIVIYSIVLSWVFVVEVSVFVIVIVRPTLHPCKTSASCYWSLCKETGKPLINLPFFFSSRKLHKFPIKIVMMMMMTTSSHDDDDDNGNQPTGHLAKDLLTRAVGEKETPTVSLPLQQSHPEDALPL